MPRTDTVRQEFVRPVDLSVVHSTEEEFAAIVLAALRRVAIERGREPIGEPRLISREQGAPADAPDGTLILTEVRLYEIETAAPANPASTTVEAEEREHGVWAAVLPPAPIVGVKHGLGTLNVDVDALDRFGQPTGYRAFMPISGGEVEILPGHTTYEVRIVALPDEEEAEDAPVPVSPRVTGA